MSDAQAAIARCAECGTNLPSDGSPCPTCRRPEAQAPPEACVLDPVACEPESSSAGIWLRIAGALIYLSVALALVYGSLSFFEGDFTTSSDWIFGALALGLALVALLGVKESLFPSSWKPE